MSESVNAGRTYSRKAFWTVKVIGIIAMVIVIWNVAKESGREEIKSNKAVKYVLSGNPCVVWGDVIYPATELSTRKMTVKIKKESL